MENEIIKKALYERYIEPTKKKREKYIGVEIEMPIVNLSEKAVDFSVVHNVAWEFIQHFGFDVTGRDDEGEIYSSASPENGDILSFDCSYNNLELSFGKEKNLHDIYRRFKEYYKFLQGKFSEYNYTLTGMGINPHNIGMYNYEFSSVEEILSYIESSSLYCFEREDKYINFAPTELRNFFDKSSITGEYYDNGEYKTAEFSPRLNDIQYLRTFKFIDLTFRGTAEFRSICTQPIKDSLCTAAFHLGLADKLTELSELLENDHVLYHKGYNAGELRKLFIRNNLPAIAPPDEIYSLAKNIIDLSYSALKERGLGEEEYLAPLYERADKKTNPAKHMLNLRDSGKSMKDIILEYAEI